MDTMIVSESDSKKKITDLLLFVAVTGLVGALSSLFSGGNFGEFYNSLVKPPFAPPGWLFSVTWIVLYLLMSVSAFLIYDSDNRKKCSALKIYFAQLFVNFLWSPVFFRFKSLIGAAAIVTVLVIMIGIMIRRFYPISKTAALLIIPYLAWTIFAAYLTYGFLFLN